MALTYSSLSAITERKFVPKLVDNFYNKNVLLMKLRESEELQDGGLKIIEPLEYAEVSAGGWFQGAETLDTTDNEVYTAAEFEWKQTYAAISITRRDELMNSGDAAKISLVASKTKSAEKKIRNDVNTGLFNAGTDSRAILGLRLAIATSGTYGGISHSDYTWWNGNVDSTTTTLTMAALQGLYGDCGEGTDYPNLIVSNQDVYDIYWNLLQPQQRFIDESMAKAGFKSLTFNGVPWVVDAAATASNIFMLHLDYLKWKPHREENFRFEPFAKPINQNLMGVAKIFLMAALTSSNNRRHGRFSAITG